MSEYALILRLDCSVCCVISYKSQITNVLTLQCNTDYFSQKHKVQEIIVTEMITDYLFY